MERTLYGDYDATYPIRFGALGSDFNASETLCSALGPIWFKGGVPGKRDWICAQLSQFIADCIMLTVVELGEIAVLAALKQKVSRGAP